MPYGLPVTVKEVPVIATGGQAKGSEVGKGVPVAVGVGVLVGVLVGVGVGVTVGVGVAVAGMNTVLAIMRILLRHTYGVVVLFIALFMISPITSANSEHS